MVNFASKTSNVNVSLLHGTEYRKTMSKRILQIQLDLFLPFSLEIETLKSFPCYSCCSLSSFKVCRWPKRFESHTDKCKRQRSSVWKSVLEPLQSQPKPAKSHMNPFGCWFLFAEVSGCTVGTRTVLSMNIESGLTYEGAESSEARKPHLLTVNCKFSWKNIK